MTLTYPLARYRFDFEVISTIRLPEYAGSTLRGAFGHALRQLACVTRAKTCDGCLLAATCPYTSVFEPQKSVSGSLSLATPPVPYIIEPPEWGARQYAPGETLAFHFTLVGRAVDQLPLCIMAWRRAFARGVGVGDGTAELLNVAYEKQTGVVPAVGATDLHNPIEDCSNTHRVQEPLRGKFEPATTNQPTLYRPGETVAEHPRLLTLAVQDVPATVTLEFLTPLRLQENGHALSPSKLTARPLLTALVRRASLLAEHHHGQPLLTPLQFTELAHASNGIEGQTKMEWRDWTRRSARQQCTMQLGGCIGTWTLTGDLAPFWDFLRLGVYLHVGKEASFGLGQYRLLPKSFE